jgi:hypothetical protein
VVYRKERDFKPTGPKRLEGVFAVSLEIHESKDGSTVADDTGTTEDLWHILHPVKFTETHEMVIMAMSPDDTADSGRTAGQELLAEIWGSLDEDILIFLFDEERGSQPLDTG